MGNVIWVFIASAKEHLEELRKTDDNDIKREDWL